MKASYDLVRGNPGLLWFPVVSISCLVLTAGFWMFEGTWLYAIHGPRVLYLPLVVVALYSLSFIGVFFNVALAGAAARALEGESSGVGDGFNVAWARLSGIAGWAAFSLFVSFVISFVKSIKGLRWLGVAAQIAWSFATIFVVPLIAFEGLDSGRARRRSFELASANWQSETAGLGALRAVLLVPAALFYVDAKLLFEGHVHSPSAKLVLGFVLLCGFATAVAAGVVRQVFAVKLYRASGANVALAAT
jgi:Family of unknown function (DUF6159)